MNKKIWTYWHQGFNHGNEVIQQCVNSWRFHNPDWELILLDQYTVYEYIDSINVPKNKLGLLRVQHKSDLIRTKLLIKYGGVWVDPTCFCIKPLNGWLLDSLNSGVFFFYQPARDRIIANWFIAANEVNNPLLVKLYDYLCNYWTENNFRNHHEEFPFLESILLRLINRTPLFTRLWFSFFFTKILRMYPYMIYHYMFYKLINTDARCKKIWEQIPKHSALEPPILQRLGLLNPISTVSQNHIDQKIIPLFKLKWNLGHDTIKDGSILKYLFSSLK